MQAGRRTPTVARQANTGFTLVWVLAVLVIMSIGLATVGPNWQDQARREREQDLLRIGTLYAQAIANYYQASPGSQKRFPKTLDDLVLDTRFVGLRRHIRKTYSDPLNPDQSWGLVKAADGGVKGVFSQSTEVPLRQEVLDLGFATLPRASRYSEWKFVPRVDP